MSSKSVSGEHVRNSSIFGGAKLRGGIRILGFAATDVIDVQWAFQGCLHPVAVDEGRARGQALVGGRTDRMTTDSSSVQPVAEHLVLRWFRVEAANTVWCAALTYVSLGEGCWSLAVVIDSFSRKVVWGGVSERMIADLALAALRMASERRPPTLGLLRHPDLPNTRVRSTDLPWRRWGCHAA